MTPQETSPQVTIVGGSGDLGQGLAMRLAAAGVPIVLGSREAARGEAAASAVTAAVPGADVRGAANAEAVAGSGIVIVCVPFATQASTFASIRDSLSEGQLVVDATVPLATASGGKPTRVLGVWQGSAAQQAQELVPAGVTVLSAFHTVSAAMLADLDHQLDEDVLVCGQKKADKQQLLDLIARIDGLRGIDAGPLDQARIIESLTAMLIGMNIRYKTHAGIRIQGIPS